MILIGLHPKLFATTFYAINTLADLAHCKTHQTAQEKGESIAYFQAGMDKDFALCSYAKTHHISFAVYVDNVVEFLACAAFLPKYLIIDKNPKIYQDLVDTYLLDSKVLAIIEQESQIPSLASAGIDGVVFRQYLNNPDIDLP